MWQKATTVPHQSNKGKVEIIINDLFMYMPWCAVHGSNPSGRRLSDNVRDITEGMVQRAGIEADCGEGCAVFRHLMDN